MPERRDASRPATDRRPFVFLDKDGTVVEDVPYSADPDQIRLTPGAGAALRALRAAGFELAIVSNQSGVARGYFEEPALEAYEDRLRAILAGEGVELAAFLYCPHHPDGSIEGYAVACDCRKPEPGMLLRAERELGADLARSWLVGDILDDVEAGHRAGCRAILVDGGHETEWQPGPGRRPDAVVHSLEEAASTIVGEARRTPESPEPPEPPDPAGPPEATKPVEATEAAIEAGARNLAIGGRS